MKLNLTNVLNEIEKENATMIMLLDPEADWNVSAIEDFENLYAWEKMLCEGSREQDFEYLDYCDKYGIDYTGYKVTHVPTWPEFMAEMREYMIAA